MRASLQSALVFGGRRGAASFAEQLIGQMSAIARHRRLDFSQFDHFFVFASGPF